ncbi:hypothetical protein J4481_02605 [Candidatus Pacearchaeota archaeon]|nr:hypothetical protein [Candidatus Pacearchaeota archaeon]
MEMMYIVLIVAGAILLLGLIMFIISKMKGGIKIELTNFNFSAGDTIEGKVILNLKKPVNAKTLNVGLVGEMKSTSYGSGHSSSRTQKVFEFSQPLDGKKEYQIGEKVYDFKMKVPQNVNTNHEGMIGNLVKSAQLLTGNMRNVKWYVKANLDITGFDISKKVQINIG